MDELEKTARELIWAITEKTLRRLKDEGLLKKPSNLQMQGFNPKIMSLIKKLSAPKHDPNRKFRKGDIVEMDSHGRDIAASLKKAGIELGKRYTVTEDESDTGHNTGYVSFIGDDGIEHRAMFFWLKLVTPVEELEPYVVRLAKPDGVEEWHVEPRNNTLALVAVFGHRHPHAKAAAEAERDRLNDEWRKEQG